MRLSLRHYPDPRPTTLPTPHLCISPCRAREERTYNSPGTDTPGRLLWNCKLVCRDHSKRSVGEDQGTGVARGREKKKRKRRGAAACPAEGKLSCYSTQPIDSTPAGRLPVVYYLELDMDHAHQALAKGVVRRPPATRAGGQRLEKKSRRAQDPALRSKLVAAKAVFDGFVNPKAAHVYIDTVRGRRLRYAIFPALHVYNVLCCHL